MTHRFLFPKSAVAVLALMVALALNLAPAGAQTVPIVHSYDRVHFIGQVSNVLGSSTIPDSLSLQLGTLAIDLRTIPRTTIKANSAEAQVEGLVNGDYALVTGRRVKRAWVAVRIVYDVRPFGPLRQFSGTILRVSPNNVRLLLKLDTGHNLWVRASPKAHFRMDGHLLDVPPIFTKGETIQILALNDYGWTAYEIDLHSPFYGNWRLR